MSLEDFLLTALAALAGGMVLWAIQNTWIRHWGDQPRVFIEFRVKPSASSPSGHNGYFHLTYAPSYWLRNRSRHAAINISAYWLEKPDGVEAEGCCPSVLPPLARSDSLKCSNVIRPLVPKPDGLSEDALLDDNYPPELRSQKLLLKYENTHGGQFYTVLRIVNGDQTCEFHRTEPYGAFGVGQSPWQQDM